MITSVDGGVMIDVRVVPRAAKAGLAGTRDGVVLVRLNAPPVEGAANAELIRVLADALGVPQRSVTIVRGQRGRLKRIKVAGVGAEDAARAMTAGAADRTRPPRT